MAFMDYWIHSQEVKKYFLLISTLICFLLAFAGDRPPVTAAVEQDHCSFSSLQYPHTELEVAHQNLTVHSNCRKHAFPLSVDRSEADLYNDEQNGKAGSDIAARFSHKQYLAHNYPSHNFW
jgi:hypothetical protein